MVAMTKVAGAAHVGLSKAALAATPAEAKTPAMSMRPLIGLLGVLIAAMSSEFNEMVTSTALIDIRGALGIDYDAGTWIESLYSAGLAIGMAFAPWCAVTFTLRRFALCIVAVVSASTLLIPLALNLQAVLILRVIQGFAGGLTIPLLMTTALMVLPPSIRLYGLAMYGLTATFTSPFSASLAALWTDVIGDWHFVFLAALPLSAQRKCRQEDEVPVADDIGPERGERGTERRCERRRQSVHGQAIETDRWRQDHQRRRHEKRDRESAGETLDHAQNQDRLQVERQWNQEG